VIVWPSKRATDGFRKDAAMYINKNVPETRWRSERQVRRKYGKIPTFPIDAMLVREGKRKQNVVQEIDEDIIGEVDLLKRTPSPMMIADICEAPYSLASPH